MPPSRKDGCAQILVEVPLPSAANLDWEDLAMDRDGNLWVGDIGDNLRWRSTITLYRLPEPDPRSRRTARATAFVFQYPDGPHDAEALLARDGRLFVVSKVAPPEATSVYAAEPGPRTPPSLAPPDQASPASMGRVTGLKFAFPITGGDVSRDGKRLALTGCDGLYVFIGQGAVEDLLRQQPHLLWHKGNHQVEAAGFDGYDVVLTNEQRQVFRVSAAAYENAPQVNVSP